MGQFDDTLDFDELETLVTQRNNIMHDIKELNNQLNEVNNKIINIYHGDKTI